MAYLRTYLHILLHIESLITTRLGYIFWLPTFARETSLKTTNPPKIYILWNILFCFSVICHQWQRKLLCICVNTINFFFLHRCVCVCVFFLLFSNLQSRKIDSRVNKISSRKIKPNNKHSSLAEFKYNTKYNKITQRYRFFAVDMFFFFYVNKQSIWITKILPW